MPDPSPDTERDDPLREALETLTAGVASLFSSLPFSAPENLAFLVQAKLSDPFADAREALATVPEQDPAGWEWRAVSDRAGMVHTDDRELAEYWAQTWNGHVEHRTPGSAPGPWQRVETPSEGTEG